MQGCTTTAHAFVLLKSYHFLSAWPGPGHCPALKPCAPNSERQALSTEEIRPVVSKARPRGGGCAPAAGHLHSGPRTTATFHPRERTEPRTDPVAPGISAVESTSEEEPSLPPCGAGTRVSFPRHPGRSHDTRVASAGTPACAPRL